MTTPPKEASVAENKEKMMKDRQLRAALDAIDKIFVDTGVSQSKTLELLQEVQDDVESKIECIKTDMERTS